MYTALKASYDRKTKSYKLYVLEPAPLYLVRSGYFVYETTKAADALARLEAGRCLTMWDEGKRELVANFLRSRVDSGAPGG